MKGNVVNVCDLLEGLVQRVAVNYPFRNKNNDAATIAIPLF